MNRFEALKGHVFTPVTATVEAGRLRFFHKAIGETNPAVAGPDASGRVPAPPTYLFCLEMLDAANPFAFVDELGVRITEILHGEQAFTYHALVHVGDELTFHARLSDVFHKKGGELTFLVQQIHVANKEGAQVAEILRTLVFRNEAPALAGEGRENGAQTGPQGISAGHAADARALCGRIGRS